jgi:hypothetical protein
MRTEWILFALLSLLWLAAGGIPWKALLRRKGDPKRSKSR